MIFRINERYRIITDPLQYIIQCNKASAARREQGKDQWTSMKYYTTFCGAVNGLIELDLRAVELESFSDTMKRSKTLVREITAALLPRYEVIQVEEHKDGLQNLGDP